MTPEEARLWTELKGLRTSQGLHFRKQVPLARYVVDFACLARKLIIELDGSQHTTDAHISKDQHRDAWLQGYGYEVLRFPNWQVARRLDEVMDVIVVTALARDPTHHAAHGPPSPCGGGTDACAALDGEPFPHRSGEGGPAPEAWEVGSGAQRRRGGSP